MYIYIYRGRPAGRLLPLALAALAALSALAAPARGECFNMNTVNAISHANYIIYCNHMMYYTMILYYNIT